MTAYDLKNELVDRLNLLREGIRGFRGLRWNETRDLLFEFPDRPGALDLVSERMLVARMLRKSKLCRRALAIDGCTVRVEGVSANRITDVIRQAAELGANQWMVMA